jgi:hypothetical protein
MYHLLKSLYGLKQAPQVWYEFFDKFLFSQGFVRCLSNTKCFLQVFFIFLGLYIDNLIFISANLQYILVYKVVFAQRFSMTNNNDIEYIPGIQIWLDPLRPSFLLSLKTRIFLICYSSSMWPLVNLLYSSWSKNLISLVSTESFTMVYWMHNCRIHIEFLS